MITMMIIGSLIALGLGLAVKLGLDLANSDYQITWPEFGMCALAIVCIVAPLVSWIGEKAAFSNQVTYHESWGGYETRADWDVTTCSEDGPCVHTYDCDPYEVKVVDQEAYTDDKGHYHAEESHEETRYHDCPYTTEEWTFGVETTLGDYTIASHNLPSDPEQHRWEPYRGEYLPGGMPQGIPEFWQQAKNRIDSGNPGPVTARRDYDNYILASQASILHKYSASIDQYKKAGLLPPLAHDIYNFYYEDRVYFEGAQPPGNWQWSINQFDAALGASLQGDLHLVIVNANKVSNPDDYTAALTAYWQSPQLGKDALSKNGIVVVIGTKDGQTVDWARASTGMPAGNEAMLIDIQNNLVGTRLTPDALLGSPTASISLSGNKASVTVHHTNGALENILMGGPHAFARVCMKCASTGDHGTGYTYLKSEIQPTGWQKFFIDFFVVLLSCGIWGAMIAYGVPAHRTYIAPRFKRQSN